MQNLVITVLYFTTSSILPGNHEILLGSVEWKKNMAVQTINKNNNESSNHVHVYHGPSHLFDVSHKQYPI